MEDSAVEKSFFEDWSGRLSEESGLSFCMSGSSCVESNGPASDAVDAANVEETNVAGGVSSCGDGAVEGWSRAVEDSEAASNSSFLVDLGGMFCS